MLGMRHGVDMKLDSGSESGLRGGGGLQLDPL